MAFDVGAEAYDRFMGRYSDGLAPQMADLAGVARPQRALDVGCGPGSLTAVLVVRLGAEAVAAADPSPQFTAALRGRHPRVRVETARAEELPFPDAAFDVALAQLVVHFMEDPAGGVAEMRRVTRPGGTVAVCVWDTAGGRAPISPFWAAVSEGDPGARGERRAVGGRKGQLAALLAGAGLSEVEEAVLTARVDHPSFEDWWEPYTDGVGPAGAYVAGLEPAARDALRERCRGLLPAPPFTFTAHAWAARGRVPGGREEALAMRGARAIGTPPVDVPPRAAE